jgi:hypothetical protein
MTDAEGSVNKRYPPNIIKIVREIKAEKRGFRLFM